MTWLFCLKRRSGGVGKWLTLKREPLLSLDRFSARRSLTVCFTRTPWYTRLLKFVGTEGTKWTLEEFNDSTEQLEEVVTQRANSSPLYTKLGRRHIRLLLWIQNHPLGAQQWKPLICIEQRLRCHVASVQLPLCQIWLADGFWLLFFQESSGGSYNSPLGQQNLV